MIKLGIVGTGAMASVHAEAFSELPAVELVACCDLDSTRAADFASIFGIPGVYSDAEELLQSGTVDAISIVTSDASHARIALAALEKRLHVLCEKPLATTVEDAERMSERAAQSDVVNMVNFSYRRSSALQAGKDLVDSGDLGRILHFDAYYLQSWLVSKAWGDWKKDDTWLWRLSTHHGSGGVLGDIGVHLLDFVTHCAGDVDWLRCDLRTFTKTDGDRIGKYHLDANDSAVITISLIGGGLGTLRMSRWATGHLNSIGISVHGDRGAIRINLDDSYEVLQYCSYKNIDDAQWESLEFDPAPSIYERFVTNIQSGRQDQPDFVRGAYVQKLLQAAFDSHERKEAVNVKA